MLAPAVAAAGAHYTGVDISLRLISAARRRHGAAGDFIVGDARQLSSLPLRPHAYDAVTFLLSIQDMDPLDEIFASASWALRSTGRILILMTHPAFRQPRHSGWGYDESRKLRYRRVDAYLTPMRIPMKAIGRHLPTVSFHRPLQSYVAALRHNGFIVSDLREIPDLPSDGSTRVEAKNPDIPLFLGLAALRASD